MKKVIKLLFPKTYKAIFDDGYYQAYSEFDYDPDYNDYQQYDDYHPDYDEYYNQIAEDWEEECRQEEQLLEEIYIPKPPTLEVGDKIHLHSKLGMYTVTEVYTDSFAYCTKHSDISYADYSDYKCHAGGKWNLKRT